MERARAANGDAPAWVDVVTAVLLALATVATAWSSYQANRWTAEQSKAAARANATRVEAARAAGLASSLTEVDIATFIQWVDATAHDDTDLAQFYVDRFRAEFRPVFDVWIAMDPLANASAPPTPFAMEQYRLSEEERAEELDSQAAVASARALTSIQRATNYVLCVVLFAVALFFAGISTHLKTPAVRRGLLVFGCVLFVVTAAWVATFPVSFSV
jgi:hypothetical protein